MGHPKPTPERDAELEQRSAGDDGIGPWSDDRYLLQDRYLELTRELLPRAAQRGGWAVSSDHCFMRILLDHACGGCWYDRLDRRLRAYKQLTNEQLRGAIGLAERMLAEGEATVAKLNRQSLRWRAKR